MRTQIQFDRPVDVPLGARQSALSITVKNAEAYLGLVKSLRAGRKDGSPPDDQGFWFVDVGDRGRPWTDLQKLLSDGTTRSGLSIVLPDALSVNTHVAGMVSISFTVLGIAGPTDPSTLRFTDRDGFIHRRKTELHDVNHIPVWAWARSYLATVPAGSFSVLSDPGADALSAAHSDSPDAVAAKWPVY